MAGLCHLRAHVNYDNAVMKLVRETFADESLRAPNVTEVMLADERALCEAYDLANGSNTSLEDALACVSAPGGELSQCLGPGPKAVLTKAGPAWTADRGTKRGPA